MDVVALLLPALAIGVTITLTALLARLASLVIGRLMSGSAPVAAVGARRLGAIVVWVIGGSFALQLAGVAPEVLLLVVGLFGVAALVALRHPLENFGAKFFSDVYVPYKVGDSITVGPLEGKVIEINAMTTVLLTPDDRLASVPNTKFLRETIVNTSPQAWKELSIPVSVGPAVDLPSFESAVLKSLARLRTHLDPRFPPVLTTKARGSQRTDLLLTLMIRRPEDRETILAESSRRIAEVLGSVEATARKVDRT